MDVSSLCPLPVAPLLWQRAPSRWALTVICKATLLLEPGVATLAPEQEPLNDHENHWDDDPRRSLFAPSDLVPFKPRAEVLLVGSAFARGGQPVRALVARLHVGAVDKSIEVLCARVRTRDGELREGKRWTKMPLLYERASGGPDTWNPAGLDPAGPRDPYGQVQLPNLQPPGLVGDEPVAPIGFGPLAATWLERKRRAPAHDLAPFGEGFDPSFFQSAPLDQQVDALRPGEPITLENLDPKHALLVTALPDLQPRALVELDGAPGWELALVADTLWIDTHRSLCTVTFRGRVELDRADPEGRILVAVGKADQKLHWAQLAPPRSRPGGAEAKTAPILSSKPVSPPGVPTSLSAARASLVSIPSPPAARPGSDPGEPPESLEVTETDPPVVDPRATRRPRADTLPHKQSFGEGPALPFQPARPGWQPPPAAISFGPPPPPVASTPTAQVSTQKLDMAGFRASLPSWLEASAPPAPPAPPPVVAPPAPVPMLMRNLEAPAPPVRAWVAEPPPLPAPIHEVPAPTGLLAASNAAVTAIDRPVLRAVAEARPGAAARVALELIWFDPAVGAKLAKHPAFAQWKRAPPVKEAPPAPAASKAKAPPVDAISAEVTEELVRAHVYDALTKGAASQGRDLEAALEASEDDSPPTPPLVVVSGELTLGFDETEVLKAVVAAASPLASSDKKLKEALDHATEMLAAPLSGMPEVAEGLGNRIREAWVKANRLLPSSYLAVCTERMLLEKRHYQRRELLDDTWIRALFSGAGLEAPVPAYLPAKIARRLPLFRRFPAQLLAEVVWQQDEAEIHPIALRVMALGRRAGRRAV